MLVIYYSFFVRICNVDEFLQVVFVAWCCVERDQTAADIDGADCRGGRVFVAVAVAAEKCKGFLDFTFFFGGNVVFFGEFGSPFGGRGGGRSRSGGGRFAFGWLCDSLFSLLESLMTTSCAFV